MTVSVLVQWLFGLMLAMLIAVLFLLYQHPLLEIHLASWAFC